MSMSSDALLQHDSAIAKGRRSPVPPREVGPSIQNDHNKASFIMKLEGSRLVVEADYCRPNIAELKRLTGGG